MVLDGVSQAGLLPLMLCALILRARSYLWLFVLALLVALYLTFPGGAGQSFSRYDFVLLPVVLALLTQAARSDLRPASIAAAVCLVSLVGAPGAWATYRAESAFVRTGAADTAAWAQKNIPRGSAVLIHDAGYIAYATNLHLVDMVGLKTADSVPYHKALTAVSKGALRGKAISEIARRFNASYAIVVDDQPHYWVRIVSGLRQQGWDVKAEHATAPDRSYIVYKLTPPMRPGGA
jgi:hypothetical protein